jgi:predicted small metal-binding protein
MKTMTCKELGGPCDQPLSARSWDDMVRLMATHIAENHPVTAKRKECTTKIPQNGAGR